MIEISLNVDNGNNTQAIAISSTSAQSAILNAGYAVITVTTDAFMTRGPNPTAVAPLTAGARGGAPLLAGVQYRIAVNQGDKLAFITSSASGTAYVSPGA